MGRTALLGGAGGSEAVIVEQLGGLDSAFLYCETPTMHMQVCGLLMLDTATMPDGYSFERIRSLFVERLKSIQAVHQKVAWVPGNLSRPYWVDDPSFDMDRHVHRVALAPRGGMHLLADLVGDIASWPLRRDHPLWELWVVEEVADGWIALVVKMHHSTIDGVSGASLMGRLFDLEAAPPVNSTQVEDLQSEPPPSQWELLRRGIVSRILAPVDVVRLVPDTALHAARTAWRLVGRRGDGVPTAVPFTAPRTEFNQTITARRSVAFTDVELADIKRVKNYYGVTVNDVVTAVVGGALRRYLDDRGQLPDRSLIAAAPVSVHDQTPERGGMTKVSVMFSTLATDEKDPVDRLKKVSAANDRAKEIHRMVGADTLMRWAEHFWIHSFALGARLYSSLHLAEHHPVVHNLILSNVPGPPVPLYIAGARLVGLYPLGPITDGAALNVTVLSEEDRMGFGIITCPDLVPRVWDVADAIPDVLNELVATIPNE
jgi:diacylglycerol O-acyltransferase